MTDDTEEHADDPNEDDIVQPEDEEPPLPDTDPVPVEGEPAP